MAVSIVRVRVCDICGESAHNSYRISRYKGDSRQLDICEEHAAPLEQMIAGPKKPRGGQPKKRTVYQSEAEIPHTSPKRRVKK